MNKIRVVMDIYSIPQLDEIKEEIMVELRLSHYWQVNLAIRFRPSKKATLQGTTKRLRPGLVNKRSNFSSSYSPNLAGAF